MSGGSRERLDLAVEQAVGGRLLGAQRLDGDRHGTLRIDHHRRPFRASAAGNGLPHYVYPLGSDGWEAVEQGG